MPQTARELAFELLNWNRRYLLADSKLTTDIIRQRFADIFTVRANGREYPANPENYLTFLDGFKKDIAAINYQITQTVEQSNTVVLCMKAMVNRISGNTDEFEAMLLLEFDNQGKVTLWHEVYLPRN
ncbi:hypothetical protein VQ643_09085 [Pseudomonas sp. F1_0610]|uniref:hypothetical protein n=1 Tax=Pseudomonas sp. F1_0610 TaxID=3114284 RepID=UPI0039C2DC18